MWSRELGSIFPHKRVPRLCPSPWEACVVPEKILDAEVAPQLTVQNGNDDGDLGGAEAWLIEEEDELGYKLCLVSHFSIPGAFPGECRKKTVKAFTGMNQIFCVSPKKVFQAELALWPSDSDAHLATHQNAVRHPSNTCLPRARVTWGKAPYTLPPQKLPSKTNPNYWLLNSKPQGKLMVVSENSEQSQQTPCDHQHFPTARGMGTLASLSGVCSSCPPQTTKWMNTPPRVKREQVRIQVSTAPSLG